jgi:hypothetical protein
VTVYDIKQIVYTTRFVAVIKNDYIQDEVSKQPIVDQFFFSKRGRRHKIATFAAVPNSFKSQSAGALW